MIEHAPICGIEMIQRFENCHLTAYPDPKTKGRPYTIGWGSTRKRNGQPFQLGEKITQAEADDLFSYQIETEFMPALTKIPYFAQMNEEQVGALLSFAYNLGANFYGAKGFATISRRLRNREWELVPEALSLYVDPGSEVEEGLKSRRKDEGALWSKGLAKHNTTMKRQILALRNTVLKKQPIQSYQLTYNQRKEVPAGKGYQILKSTEDINNHSKVELDYGAGVWYIYNPHWEITSIKGAEVSPTSKTLKAKYFSQRDSTTVHAHRMCFSSSCAMMADYLNPVTIQVAEQEDDYYMKNYIFKYGDSTNPNSQVSALHDLGITAQFRQNLSPQDVISQIDKGIPVPVGFLHHGPVNSPQGGGHWIVIIGYDLNTKQWIVHDPYGELDVVNGGYYGSINGANQRYSFKNFNRRWEVNNDGTSAPGKGWGIIVTSW